MSADVRCLVVGADAGLAATVASAADALPGMTCAGVADPVLRSPGCGPRAT